MSCHRHHTTVRGKAAANGQEAGPRMSFPFRRADAIISPHPMLLLPRDHWNNQTIIWRWPAATSHGSLSSYPTSPTTLRVYQGNTQATMAILSFRKHSLRTRDDKRTTASELTLRQSIFPLCLVTILFFLLGTMAFLHPPDMSYKHCWPLRQGFSYGLLDTLNKYFQNTLSISKARSSGLQAAYFGRSESPDFLTYAFTNCLTWAYPLASLGQANWILRQFGYKAVFIWGLCLYGVGSLIAWPCLVYRSFGGFCAAIFVIGNGLGSMETAANLYLAGKLLRSAVDSCRSLTWTLQSVVHHDIRRSASTSLKPSTPWAPSLLLCWAFTFLIL